MKLLVLSVACIDEFAADVPKSFVVNLHPDDMSEILHLASEVKRLGVSSVEKSFPGGRWTTEEAENLESERDKTCILQAACDRAQRVQIPILKVHANYFGFNAVPYLASDQCMVRTAGISIEELSSPDTYFEDDPHSFAA